MEYLALAADFDGTLAEDGHVGAETIGAIERLRASGRRVILVTGRQLPELQATFPDVTRCDVVVAENGGVLYWPLEDREEVLGQPPPEAFIAEMNHRNVRPCSLGRVIFATWRPHETAVLEAIQRLGIGYQIIFNKRAVMVLPSNVNKASGLLAALDRLAIPAAQVVGIGDAENDHAFLEVCGLAAAVQNALPALKERCDLVLSADHGAGVVELIDRWLAGNLPDPRARQTPATIATKSGTL